MRFFLIASVLLLAVYARHVRQAEQAGEPVDTVDPEKEAQDAAFRSKVAALPQDQQAAANQFADCVQNTDKGVSECGQAFDAIPADQRQALIDSLSN